MDNVDDQSKVPGMNRRSVLKGAAMGGALVWATPVVQTLGAGVAAASSHFTLTGCPTPEGGTGKPTLLRFTYVGGGCANPAPPAQGLCTGGPMTAETVTINAQVLNPASRTLPEVTATKGGPHFDLAAEPGWCGQGNNQGLGNNMRITITGGGVTQVVEFHTSCSSALTAGEMFGSLRFEGGVFNC